MLKDTNYCVLTDMQGLYSSTNNPLSTPSIISPLDSGYVIFPTTYIVVYCKKNCDILPSITRYITLHFHMEYFQVFNTFCIVFIAKFVFQYYTQIQYVKQQLVVKETVNRTFWSYDGKITLYIHATLSKFHFYYDIFIHNKHFLCYLKIMKLIFIFKRTFVYKCTVLVNDFWYHFVLF